MSKTAQINDILFTVVLLKINLTKLVARLNTESAVRHKLRVLTVPQIVIGTILFK